MSRLSRIFNPPTDNDRAYTAGALGTATGFAATLHTPEGNLFRAPVATDGVFKNHFLGVTNYKLVVSAIAGTGVISAYLSMVPSPSEITHQEYIERIKASTLEHGK
tara:strand:+ start:106 stop:423 length:318 start_codon:yes stop_codon:yes gene_type:complete